MDMENVYRKRDDGWFHYYQNVKTGEKKFELEPGDILEEDARKRQISLEAEQVLENILSESEDISRGVVVDQISDLRVAREVIKLFDTAADHPALDELFEVATDRTEPDGVSDDSRLIQNVYRKRDDGWFHYYQNVKTGEKKLDLEEGDILEEDVSELLLSLEVEQALENILSQSQTVDRFAEVDKIGNLRVAREVIKLFNSVAEVGKSVEEIIGFAAGRSVETGRSKTGKEDVVKE